MPREIELKFALDPGDGARLRACAALAAARPAKRRLLAIYFDTTRGELAGNGMALRLRRSGRSWTQTLKSGASGAGGLHERSEWEFAHREASLDLALFAASPLAKLEDPAKLHERLAETFRIESVRTAWVVESAPGTRVEVVLDVGAIAAGGRRAPVCEVEVESIEGDVGAIFTVAARLLEEVGLRPSAVSKAERGARLRSGARLRPKKAAPIRLDGQATQTEAARTVVGAGLEQLQANEEGLLTSTNPEFVHQARVALRRVRSAIRIFRDAIGTERAEAWRSALGETGRALGVARDWDVFGTEVLPPVFAAYGDAAIARRLKAHVARRRGTERHAARTALGSRPQARAILDLARFIALAEPAAAGEPLADFASDLIRKRHKRLVADARRFGALTAEERHRLRIDVKRLRYSLDALASLFPERRVERYLEVLVALQDALGQANDAVTASRLLPQVEPPEAFAIFARGWFAARAAGDGAVFAALVEALAATPRFWRKRRTEDPAES